MTYEDAVECDDISLNEALRELKRHGIHADYEGAELFDCETGETIAMADTDGQFSGSDILGWLGY
jgi:hypothetical protein